MSAIRPLGANRKKRADLGNGKERGGFLACCTRNIGFRRRGEGVETGRKQGRLSRTEGKKERKKRGTRSVLRSSKKKSGERKKRSRSWNALWPSIGTLRQKEKKKKKKKGELSIPIFYGGHARDGEGGYAAPPTPP